MTANEWPSERASERESMKKSGEGGREAGPRCTCVRVRVTSEFLTVHWEEIIREWVKPWVIPPQGERESNGWEGEGGNEKEREIEEGEAGAKRTTEVEWAPRVEDDAARSRPSGGRKIILN